MVDISGSYGKLRKWVTRQLNSIKLENLADVDKSSQGDNKVLVYKAVSGKHEYLPFTGGEEDVGTGFNAWRNSAQSIPNTTATQIIFNTELFDIDNEYDVATGKYTPQKAGYYTVHANIVIASLGDGKKYIIRLEKNGSIIAIDRGVSGGLDYCGGCASGVIYMNGTTDYLGVKFYHNHGTALNTASTAGNVAFSAWLLPAPP